MSKRHEPSIEWYKETLEHFTTFIEQQIHPDYGSCDGLGEGGNCSVCLERLDVWKTGGDQRAVEAVRARREIISRVKRIRREIEQVFTDAASWNENGRPEGEAPTGFSRKRE